MPEVFFARELPGEPPLTRATAADLLIAANAFRSLEPWDVLAESQFVFIQDPDRPESFACTVIGSGGESYGLLAFYGAAGYALLHRIYSERPSNPFALLEDNRSLTAQFVPRSDLEEQDRDLLKTLGHKPAARELLPEFRSSRPEYLPWFINEAEGASLVLCLNGVARVLAEGPAAERLWPDEHSFPLVDADGEIRIVRPAPSVESIPEIAAFDPAAVAQLCEQHPRREGIVEVDFFYSPVPIGERYQRKMMMRLALAAEAETGIVHEPRIVSPGETAGTAMAAALLGAVRTRGSVPAEVHVRDGRRKVALSALAKALGSELRVRSELGAVEPAFQAILSFSAAPQHRPSASRRPS